MKTAAAIALMDSRERNNPKKMNDIQKGLYEHYKGKRYQVVDVARHSESLELMVVYKALYKGDFPEGSLWVRPLTMFQENVSVNGKVMPRFKFISPA